MRRPILCAAAPACLLLGLTPAAASAEVVPAPPATATAAAATVSNLAGISTTGAKADDAKADAQAAVVSLGGNPVLGTGGSQSSEGETGGALVDTGESAPVHVQVAPWKAKATGSKTSAKRSSQASAAAARVKVPGVIKAGVLTSDSSAEHTTQQSVGKSTSDAADVTLADTVRVVLLHSEVDSNAKGHSYLVGFDGTEIGTEEQVGEICSLEASGLASLSCLTASGGTANGITSGAAEVLGVETALGLNPASAFSTAATTGTGSITPSPSILPAVGGAILQIDTARAAAPAAVPSAQLPRTGVAAASLAAAGLAGLLAGLVLRFIGRRRLVGSA